MSYMDTKQPKDLREVFSFRTHSELMERAGKYADKVGVTKSTLVEALLRALCDGRLWVEPLPEAFPGVPTTECLPLKPPSSVLIPPGTYPHRLKEK